MKKIVWNQACHYWTGKKFKVCCGKKGQKTFAYRGRSVWYAVLILSVVVIFMGILWYNDNNVSNSIRTTSILPLWEPFNSSGDASIIPTTYTNIPGVDLSTLSDSQRRIVLQKTKTTSAAPAVAAILLLGASIWIQRAAPACLWRNRSLPGNVLDHEHSREHQKIRWPDIFVS